MDSWGQEDLRRNQTKTLLGIETRWTTTGRIKARSRNQTKTLLGIETLLFRFTFLYVFSRNQTKTLLGIETFNLGQSVVTTRPQSN